MNADDRAWRSRQREMEQLADAFRARYGVAEDGAWTDSQLERALADNGYPALSSLPDEPRGMMAGSGCPDDRPGLWQRQNAAHLLGHAIMHGGGRCGGCEDW